MKRRVVVVFFALFALWPLAHRGLVAAYDANPWKLAGWAMYTRPHFPSRVELIGLRGGEEQTITELTPWERTLLDEYVERRYTLGDLASPGDLAEALLERLAGDEAIAVRVTTRYFDLSSARIRERVQRLEFRR